MTKFNYSRMQNTASRLLNRFAQGTITLSRAGAQTAGANEWDAPTVADATIWTLDATVSGVSAKYVNGDTIQATDRQVMAAVFDDVPQLGDVLTIGGVPVTILQIMPVPAAGTVCAWTIIVKG